MRRYGAGSQVSELPSFSPCLKWLFSIVGICHHLERHNVGNTYLLKCVLEMAKSNEIASWGTLWLHIENNSNNDDDITIKVISLSLKDIR